MIRLAARPLVLVFVLSAFLYVLIEQAIGTWLPTFNNEVLHLPQAMSIQATSIFAASIAIGRLGAGAILTRIGWYPLVNIFIVAMALLVLVSLPLTRSEEHTSELQSLMRISYAVLCLLKQSSVLKL